MKVLVTGSSGFIGNQVVMQLLERKDVQVIVTSRDAEKAKRCDWYGKVEYKPAELYTAAENRFDFFGRPDKLIHLAWQGLPNFNASHHLTETLPGEVRFLEGMLNNGLTDISVAGTCLEYGLQEGCLAESLSAEPVTAYGIAKDALHSYLQQSVNGRPIHFRWMRLFYPYGKGQSEKSLVPQLEKAITEKRTVFDLSPGDQQRDFLQVETMARYIVAIALQQETLGIINVCSGTPVTVKTFVENYLRQRGISMQLRTGVYSYPAYEPRNFWGDPSKLNRILQHE